ncbi:uncharacterized protein ATNIH1004_007922 [Aspergillus tanneri]|uniref:TRP C-terminal domain-containing protein n=1 Tax=Aspergillus tanneri TaxID=1220188 RepID=A0A5M9MPM4_9EURO|nr:uncharacterized protein ATNIH1004_007922 [Aspergillus tanneri]KAA8646489.1 hypothetical protein ATNIH1004_007922 [Aspergillus tanneri]
MLTPFWLDGDELSVGPRFAPFPILHFLHVLVCAMPIPPCGLAAWVRKYQCDSVSIYPHEKFRVDSIRGTFDTSDSSTVLSLAVLGVYNTSRFACDDLNLTGLETSLRFHVLGYPVGQLESFRSECPLPITDTLTPPQGLLFSKHELEYSFGHAHRLHTLAAELSFKAQESVEVDCAAVKVTPYIGIAASAILTYIPVGVLVLVNLTSWVKRRNQLGRNWLFEYRTSWSSQGPIWDVTLDIADYLRYLQFIFLAGSLTMEYPGFYQPVVSQVAWSSLLYWSGPIDHGFTWTGVEGGMYVSNTSYGLEYMSQILGFPKMPDIMLDSFINLFVLITALIVVLLIICLITLGSSRPMPPLSSVLRNAGCIILGVTLSCFSLPLLSYMSYELILIGYLPNYRVTLVGLMIAVLVCSNFFIAYHFERQKERRDTALSVDSSPRDSLLSGSRELAQTVSHYIPHAIPLLQGIVIGGFQYWGLTQIIVLGGCEIILLLHMAIQRRASFFASKATWCATVRLLTLLLSIVFPCRSSEKTRQWVGYFILCLHSAVVIFGFLFISLWQLYRSTRKRIGSVHNSASDRSNHSNVVPPLGLDYLSPHRHDNKNNNAAHKSKDYISNRRERSFDRAASSTRPGSSGYRGFDDCSSSSNNNNNNTITPLSSTPSVDVKHYITDLSTFYRTPRPRNAPNTQPFEKTAAVGDSSSASSPRASSSNTESYNESDPRRHSQDILDELLEMPGRHDVDYSVRESDLYYLRPAGASMPPSTPILAENCHEDQPGGYTFPEWIRKSVPSRLKQSRKKEKGFQVMRPPRPT